ncbi:MAG: PssD/Cps14F family polysaccharide biosynthesis glycosyltransferase [Candidatus Pacearchaeota archaeon]
MKICIACSAGGHLVEASQLVDILKQHDVFFFTNKTPHIKKTIQGKRVYFTINPLRSPFKNIKVFLDSLRVFKKENPDIVISTGANVTVPMALLAKLKGKKLIFIECSAQVTSPSLTGKILYPFADLFIVQWKPLLKRYGRKAIYGGLLV